MDATYLSIAAALLLAPATAQNIVPGPGAGPRGSQLRTVVAVMPMGDSITQGGQGYASYRYSLWFALIGGPQPVDFVGALSTVFGGDGGGNPDTNVYSDYYTTFDRDHEGHWGWRTDEIVSISIAAARDAAPDVVLVHLGTNDIGQLGAAGVTAAAQNLPYILDNLRAVRPVVRVALAQVLPIGPGSGYYANEGQVGPLNTAIAQVASSMDRPHSPVVLVDQHTGYDLATDMQPDGLHPNVAGEVKMAGVWAAALGPLLNPPLPPSQPLVQLAEPSFEALNLPDGGVAEAPPIAWSFGATWSTFRGVFNPTEATYVGAAGAGTPAGADGDEVAYLYVAGGPGEDVVLFQTLPTTLEPSTTYTLTVAVGNRLPGNPYGSTWGGYRVELMAGNEVIASDADSVLPAPGTFEDVTLVVSSDNLPAWYLGQVLTVRASLTAGGPAVATDFDHVRLVAN
jgi:acyl-CoA thioesterase I